jgi:hypothetical protein
MSSLSDILTAAKNIAVALNTAAQTYISVQGAKRSLTLTPSLPVVSPAGVHLVSSGQGRLASVSVVVAGSADAMIYDSNLTTSLTEALAVVDNVLGVTVINMPYNSGLVVVPGTGMTLVVSYSEGQ